MPDAMTHGAFQKDDSMFGSKVKSSRASSHKRQVQIKKRTFESIKERLDSIRGKIKNAQGGYRHEVYNGMAEALSDALLLRSNRRLKQEFIKCVRLERQKSSGAVPVNIVTEVMIYVMGVTSESGRKIAWKRGRVIEFLHDQGIKIAKVATEIKTRGGIGAVLKQATKEDPRREKVSADEKTRAKKSEPLVKTRDEQEQDTSDSNESAGDSRRNDGQMILRVLINLSDRDMLNELPIGSRVRIFATRTNQKGAKIEVNRIKKLKPDVREENNGEWD
jgi:hypothetical protein